MVDTKLASIAEGLLIYEAIRQHQKGMTAAELADWASEALYYAHGYFMVSDLDSLHRGGRIPRSVAFAGSKLDAKPLLGFGLLEDMLVKADEDLVLVDCNIGPVIGCHVGPDMIAVAFWGKDRRETVSVVDRIANKVKKNR